MVSNVGGTTIAPTINATVGGGSRDSEAVADMGEQVVKQIAGVVQSMFAKELWV